MIAAKGGGSPGVSDSGLSQAGTAGSAIYFFDHDHGEPARGLVGLLGGKGAGLAEMTAMGLSVPAGFTIGIPVWREVSANGWSESLDAELAVCVRQLGERMGRHFGDAHDPLLLAVRSGAPISMPGMLDTVLNLGLNDETVLGLAHACGDDRFAWDSYRRFLYMYATTVMSVPSDALDAELIGDSAAEVRQSVDALKRRIYELSGTTVPADPQVQLREAILAVFQSWNSDRARTYRAKEGISQDMGTAVNCQAMVFGNRGQLSGTGVAFTRNPANGENCIYGDYLVNAQGEDVVSGKARTVAIAELGIGQPGVYRELCDVLRRLEVHYRDMCDVEFTVEEGKLWILQVRVGKRSAAAAVRIAVDLTQDPDIALSRQEALDRVPPALRQRARRDLLDQANRGVGDNLLLGIGLGASPGRVSGKIALSTEEAIVQAETSPIILVRTETSPEDIAGMAASVGILTTRGGFASHAAVVARAWGVPAVVGAHAIQIVDNSIRTSSGTTLRAGQTITIDGSGGEIWLGEMESGATDASEELYQELEHLSKLEEWATVDWEAGKISD